jgi:tripeptide aminopeptidase
MPPFTSPLAEEIAPDLLDRFLRYVRIDTQSKRDRDRSPSTPGQLDLSRLLVEELKDAGLEDATLDDNGYVMATLPGTVDGNAPVVGLIAHVDTSPDASGTGVEPIVHRDYRGGVIELPRNGAVIDPARQQELADKQGHDIVTSSGDTLLGADDKAGVAVLLELAADAATVPPAVGLELVFTVAEERGLRGASELDLAELRSGVGLVLDHAAPLEELVVAAPTYHRLLAEFEGVEAHAGLAPETGRSAVAAACAAVAAMRLGRLDDETTANVGTIEGGTAANVVPGSCRIEAEARSLDADRASDAIGAVADACTWAAGEHECDVDVDLTEIFRGYRVPPSSPALGLARAALGRCGLEPREVASGGGSDVNALRARGFDAALLAVGARDNHTPEESIAVERLTELHRIATAAVEAC